MLTAWIKTFQDHVRSLLSSDDSAAVFMVVDEMTTDRIHRRHPPVRRRSAADVAFVRTRRAEARLFKN